MDFFVRFYGVVLVVLDGLNGHSVFFSTLKFNTILSLDFSFEKLKQGRACVFVNLLTYFLYLKIKETSPPFFHPKKALHTPLHDTDRKHLKMII